MFKYFTIIILCINLLAESALAEKDIPIVPRTALRRLAGSSPLDEVFLEKDENATFYHAKWKNGAAYEASVTDDGNLAIFIEAIQKDKVPIRVKNTVESLFSKASEIEYEKETFLVYKIKVTVGDKNYEALISPSGKMVGIKEVPESMKSIPTSLL